MTWSLPTRAEIGGIEYEIASDFRDILDIISYLQGNEDEETKSLVALNLFYDGFDSMPLKDYREAAEYLTGFIDCFDPHDTKNKPKLIDWEQDHNIMAAEVNKVAGTEVRLLPYLHWFTFVGYFNSIGEGQLATICSIRKKKKTGKKLEKWEQEFYNENKSKIDFREKEEVVAEQSESEKEFWKLFGE